MDKGNNRIYWLDNLRTFLIFCVVLIHAGVVYEGSGFGTLFWIVSDPSSGRVFEILNLIIDIFVMTTIFFIAGYFTPPSLKKKSGWAFLKSKFRRLMVPWTLAVLTLMPLYKFLFLYSRNLPQESWTSYFHWSNGIFSQSWLWFLPVLFLFDILYLLLDKLNINISILTLKSAVGAYFLIGLIYSVCMDMFSGVGWTKNFLINFQNERLLIYFMIFLTGALCCKLKIFQSEKSGRKLALVVGLFAWIPVTLYTLLSFNAMTHIGQYHFSRFLDSLLIRFTLLLAMLCLIYLLVQTFRFFLNRAGKLMQELNRNSYGVYIIHTIVLGGLALTMLNTVIPSGIKYLILSVSTFAVCNLSLIHI